MSKAVKMVLQPLHKAADNGHTDCVKELLANEHIRANKKNSQGDTALHLAAFNGHKATVKELLADGRIPVNEKQNGGYTALDLAIRNHHAACKKLLKDYGAKPSACLLQ